MNNKGLKISQKDNWAGNHGYVYRSSAVFYYLQNQFFKTTISFMDYWFKKRGLEVMIIISIRNMSGQLVQRKPIVFKKGKVINSNNFSDKNFEGSVEIEIFSSKNMVIPYAAIMAVYEHKNSISMCHSYGRIYSLHEIEEKRTISLGEESCWTIRDTKKIKSFCIFHNGSGTQEEQTLKFELTNHNNDKKLFKHKLHALEPYSTTKLYPQDIFGDNLLDFLNNKPGNLSISYKLNGAFTRMLIGNMTDSEFQVTHSNFNLSVHKTDSAGKGNGYYHIPNAGFKNYEVIIYPDCNQGKYTFKYNDTAKSFTNGQRISIPVTKGVIEFSRANKTLPSRIVTGLAASPSRKNAILPYEITLGIIHKLRPLKSTFWGLISAEKNLQSRLFIVPMESIYGENKDVEMELYIYTEFSENPFVHKLDKVELEKAKKGIYISSLFPDLNNGSNGRFAWYYFRTKSYGGYQTYSTIETKKGSLTMEHAF